ncbi:MAG: aminotransferase class IV [Halieaceae bacterium]
MEQPVAEPIIYIDGNFEPLSVARISPLDQGFLLGDGIFDVVSAWDSKIFMLDAHLDRFFDSMRAARLETRLSREQWVDAIIETTRRNELSDASIRFILTRGVPDGVVADPRHIQPTEMIWAAPYIFLADEEKRSTGIRIMISSMRGFAPDTLDPRFKCLDRLNSQLIRLEALEAGYDDAVWLDGHGYVAEAAASNIFVVKNDEIFTPQTGILRGITRATVLELAERGGIPHRESQLTAFDLYSADEVFTCSTAGGPLPVREVSGRAIAATGPITKRISELYWQMRAEGEYSTPI